MEIFRKMSFADSTGDAIPFYHEGKYHIFSLTSPPGTTVYPARLRTTWSHSVSDDLVHWEELPTALYPGEGDEPDASGVWTGSVIYGEGKYHASIQATASPQSISRPYATLQATMESRG